MRHNTATWICHCRKVLAVLLVTGSAMPLIRAQEKLPVDEIEVVKHFDARLIEAQKIPLTPRLPEPDSLARQYQYQVTADIPKLTYPAPQIRPLALRPEAQPKAYRGMLRAGYGVPNAVLAEASYQVLQDGPAHLLISGHHLSANAKDHELQQFSSTGGALTGGYLFSPMLSLSGHLAYDVNRHYFYGVDPNDVTLYVDDHRDLKLFTAGAGVRNVEMLSGDISYAANIDVYDLRDDLGTKEGGMKLLLQGEKRFQGRHVLSLTMGADLSTLTDTEEKRDLDVLSVLPSFSWHGNAFAATGGVQLAGGNGSFDFFPDIRLLFQVSGRRLMVFAEATGGVSKNDFRTLSTINPYIHERIDMIANTVHRDYYAGVRGRIRWIDYEGKAGLTTYQNLALFEMDNVDYRKFQPLYDDGQMFKIEGSVTATPISSLRLRATIAQRVYDLDTQDKPWYLPAFDGRLQITQTSHQDRLRLHGALYLESGVPYLNAFGEADKLKGLFDVSLGGDYDITQHIGVFIQVNNLLNNTHQRWLHYPVYGINGIAGILIRV